MRTTTALTCRSTKTPRCLLELVVWSWWAVAVSLAFAFVGPTRHHHHHHRSLALRLGCTHNADHGNAASTRLTNATTAANDMSSTPAAGAVKILFSDIDGSLLHYPPNDDASAYNHHNDDNDNDSYYPILALPPSATGLRGIISTATLEACHELRTRHNVKLVLMSGMRTSTLLNRLPHLPRADAYGAESGGRIFYPTTVDNVDDDDNNDNAQPIYTPIWPFARDNDTATIMDEARYTHPFGLREDPTWRQQMENVVGADGYAGNEVFSDRCGEGLDNDAMDDSDWEECLIDYENMVGFPLARDVVPLEQRKDSLLWSFAQQLVTQYDLILDTKSYSTCFRANWKHQTSDTARAAFDDLMSGATPLPDALAMSTNLGCIDIYPAVSGKRASCQYIAQLLNVDMGTESVCLCDDDNDMDMALACATAYLPAVTSTSMANLVQSNPSHFVVTAMEKDGNASTHVSAPLPTLATDQALRLIAERANRTLS